MPLPDPHAVRGWWIALTGGCFAIVGVVGVGVVCCYPVVATYWAWPIESRASWRNHVSDSRPISPKRSEGTVTPMTPLDSWLVGVSGHVGVESKICSMS